MKSNVHMLTVLAESWYDSRWKRGKFQPFQQQFYQGDSVSIVVVCLDMGFHSETFTFPQIAKGRLVEDPY